MSVKLRKRKNTDGTTSLRLDIYVGGKRSYELLHNLQLSAGNTFIDKEQNKQKLKLAEEIRHLKELQSQSEDYNITASSSKVIVKDWMQVYINNYTKSDVRHMTSVRNKFIEFTKNADITFNKLDAVLVEDFIGFLESKSVGEGAATFFARFKKMMKYAYRKKITKRNVMDDVDRKVKGKARKKDTLTLEEIRLLMVTSIESPEVRRAALFSCVTGLAWIDVKNLTWDAIKEKHIEYIREKQDKYYETIVIPLNDTAFDLLGERKENTDHVFDLPSANGANKTVKAWVSRAKIKKKITWHNLRHSFGTNLILSGVDLFTTSKLLGHSSTKHTLRYIRPSEELKNIAIEKLNL